MGCYCKRCDIEIIECYSQYCESCYPIVQNEWEHSKSLMDEKISQIQKAIFLLEEASSFLLISISSLKNANTLLCENISCFPEEIDIFAELSISNIKKTLSSLNHAKYHISKF